MRRRGWTPAHDQVTTVRIVMHVPPHGLRGMAFRLAKRRMRKLGLDKCVVTGCATGAPVEYHHDKVEHAWQNGVSIRKINLLYGLHLTRAQFADWVQSPGNLEPLCSVHHRGSVGVHALPEPLWKLVRVWTDALPPPAEHITKGAS